MSDDAVPSCIGNSYPFDVLIDYVNGAGHDVALREARQMCNGMDDAGQWTCPIRERCLTENASEAWAQKVLGKRVAPEHRYCDTCDRAYFAKGKCKRHWEAARRAARKAAIHVA